MPKRKEIIPLNDLNLTSRFLFDQVMEDPQTQKEVLSIVFGREIPVLLHSETEKEVRLSPLIRSVRLDVFAIDEDEIVYNTEIQEFRKTDLAKRSRYYQGLMDTALLQPGIPDYNYLNDSYFVMIMTFDLFGCDKYCYTFSQKCEEVSGLKLNDGAVRIFLNTKGTNDQEVSAELIEFLHYLENTTDEAAHRSSSERIRRIHERVCKVKSSEEIGVKYMQAWEERYYDRQEARAEGREEGQVEGRVEALMEILTEEFGIISENLREKICKETDLEILKKWLKLAVRVKSVEQFEREMQ